MKKKELIDRLSKEMTMSKSQTGILFEEMFSAISKILAEGETVSVTNFGKFEVYEMAAKKSRNPKTGEVVDVPERKKVKFRPSVNLKNFIQTPE